MTKKSSVQNNLVKRRTESSMQTNKGKGERKMQEKKYSIKTDFSMLAILIIPISVAVNFV